MVAGPNGSGKSTLIEALRQQPDFRLPALYINADDLQRTHGITDAARAQQLATQMRAAALQARQDVMYETVMSHPSKIAELQQAKAGGYHVVVALVATDDPEINVSRVGLRVQAGGHDVPAARIRARYGRTLDLAPLAIAYADEAYLFDNTDAGHEPRGLQLQAACQPGAPLALQVSDPARWVQTAVQEVAERTAERHALSSALSSSGLALAPAELDGGRTEGPILRAARHYVVQLDTASGRAVLHERKLLGASALAQGSSKRIGYREGVASVDDPL